MPEYAFIIECDGEKSAESRQLDVRGGLKVIVKDKKTGEPLRNTNISLLQNGSIYKTVEADDNGYFELLELPIGKFEIKPKENNV